MQVRPNTDETFHFRLLTNRKDIPSYFNNLRYHRNVVILYPDPNDANGDHSDVRHFKACYIIQDELLRNEKYELIEVSMGNLSREEATYAAARIYQALDIAKKSLNFEILKNINLRVLAEAAGAEEKKRLQQAADDAVIAAIIARDVEQFDTNMTEHKTIVEVEHKIEAASSNKVYYAEGHNSNAEEVAPQLLPKVLEDIAFDYTGNVEVKNENGKETAVIKKGNDFPNVRATTQPPQFTLFGRPFLDMLHSVTELVNEILRGEDVLDIVTRVREYPPLLNIEVNVIDPLGTPVTGTLLQLAAMAGDVNLKPDITNEKDRGLVERLVDAGGLSKERVEKDLACITSERAKKANDERVERYLAIMKKFGNNLCERKIQKDDPIAQLEKELLEERRKAVNAGFIFDPRILDDTAKWFEENVNRFGGWRSPQSDVFWVKGFGKLQSLLSSRDAQVVRAGMGDLVDDDMIPERTLKNPAGDSHFYSASSRLGRDFYLGYYGLRWRGCAGGCWARIGKLISNKNNSITQLVRCSKRSRFENCSLM